MTRRTFIASASATSFAFAAVDNWRDQADVIRDRIRPPKFPNRDFEITH
jgi:hypothetical protein